MNLLLNILFFAGLVTVTQAEAMRKTDFHKLTDKAGFNDLGQDVEYSNNNENTADSNKEPSAIQIGVGNVTNAEKLLEDARGLWSDLTTLSLTKNTGKQTLTDLVEAMNAITEEDKIKFSEQVQKLFDDYIKLQDSILNLAENTELSPEHTDLLEDYFAILKDFNPKK